MQAGSNSDIDPVLLADFCRRWRVEELALFGSRVRKDFGPESDIDLLVTFEPDTHWSLLDHVRMVEELNTFFGRPIDLITRRALEQSRNWMRRQEILSTARVIYSGQRLQ